MWSPPGGPIFPEVLAQAWLHREACVLACRPRGLPSPRLLLPRPAAQLV